MRKKALFFLTAVTAIVAVGCSREAPNPEDDAFQKGLAEAAAANKGKSAETKRGGVKGPGSAEAGGAPPGAAGASK
jgi:hypothetical protein